MQKAAGGLYDGAAFIGKAKTGFTSAIWIFTLLLSMSIAIFFITQKPKRSMETEASVITSSCRQVISYTTKTKDNIQNHYSMECDVKVKYVVNSTEYIGNIITSSNKKIGDIVVIKYDPENPIDISYNEYTLSTIGWISLFVVIVILASVIGNIYLVARYKPYAAYQGAKTSINLLDDLF